MEIYKIIPLQVYEELMKNDKTQDLAEGGINVDYYKIISMLKPKQQKRGEAILSLLVRNKSFSWNSDGEISYEGKNVEKSHIFELISFVLKPFPSKRINVVGLSTFIQALEDLNIPRNLLSQQVNNMIKNNHLEENPVTQNRISEKWIRFKNS